MPTVTCCETCVKLPVLVGRDLKSVMRCNHLVQNCNPISAHQTQELMQIFHWESLGHPPNNPDLALLDCYFFGLRKQRVGGRQFHSNDEVQMAACDWLEMQEPSVVWIMLKNNYTSVE